MGRQSSAKARQDGRPPAPPSSGRSNLSWFALIGVVVLAIGAFAFLRGGNPPADEAAAAQQTDAQRKAAILDVHPTPEDEASAHARAALGPHKQKEFPPIPFRGYAPPRPAAVVTAAFQWAAEHPEIASYVPCFCGCQMMGHRGNDQCFVHARNDKGDVVEWEEHGVDCAICIDVATRSRQMYAAGASAKDIRAAIEKEYGPTAQTMTPTPRPPSN